MFEQVGEEFESKKASMIAIEEAKPITIDQFITKDKISDAIDPLECNKSSGVDGLTSDFFKMYTTVW